MSMAVVETPTQNWLNRGIKSILPPKKIDDIRRRLFS